MNSITTAASGIVWRGECGHLPLSSNGFRLPRCDRVKQVCSVALLRQCLQGFCCSVDRNRIILEKNRQSSDMVDMRMCDTNRLYSIGGKFPFLQCGTEFSTRNPNIKKDSGRAVAKIGSVAGTRTKQRIKFRHDTTAFFYFGIC